MEKKIINILFVYCLICYSLACKAQDCIDSKLLTALVYIKYNPDINEKIKKTFPYLIKKKENWIDFKINEELSFIPIYFFSYKLNEETVRLSKELLTDRKKYKDQYFFNSYKINILSNFSKTKNSKIILTLSKPVNNFLIVEFLDAEANIGSIKMGPALQLLFIFDPSGLINDVFTASPIYN